MRHSLPSVWQSRLGLSKKPTDANLSTGLCTDCEDSHSEVDTDVAQETQGFLRLSFLLFILRLMALRSSNDKFALNLQGRQSQ